RFNWKYFELITSVMSCKILITSYYTSQALRSSIQGHYQESPLAVTCSSMAIVNVEFSVDASEKSQEQPAPKRRRCWALVHSYATESPVDTFNCNQGNCKAVFTGGITSNLLSHFNNVAEEEHGKKNVATKQSFRETLVRLLLTNQLSLNLVNSESFKTLCTGIRNAPNSETVQLPSDTTVVNEIKSMYQQMKPKISELLLQTKKNLFQR
ncbi:hypothetical protein A0J61_11724, partial [Choanephora cucurbitarum]